MRQLTRLEIMRVAAATGADVRTVKTYLENRSVRPVTAEAIVRALRELKIPDPRTAPQP